MKTHFTNFALVLVLIGPPILRAEASNQGFKNQLAICAKREENKKAAEEAVKSDRIAAGCRQQIKEALDECFKNPEKLKFTDLAMSHGGLEGINGNAEKAAQIYLDGQTRFSQFAQICADQFDQVQKHCQGNSDSLKSALKQNDAAWNRSRDEIANMPATDPRRPEALQQFQSEGQTRSELLSQLNKTNTASSAATKALHDQALCYTYQGQLYAQAAVKTGEVQAAADVGDEQNDQSPGSDEKKGAEDLYSEQVKDKAKETTYAKTSEKLAEKVGDSVSESAGKVAGNVAKAGGGAFTAVSVANGDGLGATTGAASTLADFTLSPASALRFGGVMTAANMILQPTDLGHCDTPVTYLDPVVAYNANCPVTSVTGKSANESAIAALTSP